MLPDITLMKRLTIAAIVSDDELLHRLVLKGGNALRLAHRQTARASFDLDFSMADAFEPQHLPDIADRIRRELTRTFEPEGLVVFDVKLEERPENISSDLQDFWGGYSLEFKLIHRQRFDELGGELEKIRREAVAPRLGGKARFEIDISRYEFCEGKTATEVDQFTVYVYTPVMIVCEKIRALCQQTAAYSRLVRNHRASRPRDAFDIYETVTQLDIDVVTTENSRLIRKMFEAKRVPLDLLLQLEGERDFHRQGWDSVRDTVDASIDLREYDFYFDFVLHKCREMAQLLGLNPRGT